MSSCDEKCDLVIYIDNSRMKPKLTIGKSYEAKSGGNTWDHKLGRVTPSFLIECDDGVTRWILARRLKA